MWRRGAPLLATRNFSVWSSKVHRSSLPVSHFYCTTKKETEPTITPQKEDKNTSEPDERDWRVFMRDALQRKKRMDLESQAILSGTAEEDARNKGRIGRLSIATVRESKMEDVIAHYTHSVAPTYKNSEGFLGAYLMVDRDNNLAQSLTLWESVQHLDNNNTQPTYKIAMQSFATMFIDTPRTTMFELAAAVERENKNEQEKEEEK